MEKYVLNNSINQRELMDKEGLIKKLLEADQEIALSHPNNRPINVVIGGGSVLIIQDLVDRQTIDIDVLGFYTDVEDVFNKHSINSRMNTFVDTQAENYLDRLIPLELNTKVIHYYLLSLEDLVIMKLFSGREKDYNDISSPNVIRNLNWDLLDKIIEDGEVDNSFNERRYKIFLDNYDRYKDKYKTS